MEAKEWINLFNTFMNKTLSNLKSTHKIPSLYNLSLQDNNDKLLVYG